MIRDLLLQNRSYRSYDSSVEVTKEDLLDIVECTIFTPSSTNLQPLKYRLVYEAEEVANFAPLTHWAKRLPNLTLPPEGHHPTAYIVICHDTEIAKNPMAFYKDVGIVAQSMLLAAVEAGLGGCMIGNFVPEKVSENLKIDERYVPVLVLAIGKPDDIIIITQAAPGASVDYFRDENNIHYVPKRSLDEVVL
jgi:Nitroreductase